VEAIPDAIPANAANLLPGIMDSVKVAFAASMHETFAVSAAVCLLGAMIALGIQNPSRYAKRSEVMAREANLQPAHAD
jgi:hypothetical protein